MSSPSAHAQPPSTRNPRPRGQLVVSPSGSGRPSDQLANIKNQWNVERDIPTGTVRNNPFLPKPEPEKDLGPQLRHQKKQWDTRDIPRGSVAARAMSMEGDYEMQSPRNPSPRDRNSPRMSPINHGRLSPGRMSPGRMSPGRMSPGRMSPAGRMSPGRMSPGRMSPQQMSPKTHFEKGTRMQPRDRRSFPMPSINSGVSTTTSLRGRLIENPLLSSHPASFQQHHQPHNQHHHSPIASSSSTRGWEPSREIPKGTVKGRVSSLFGNRGGPDTHEDSDNDEDPWIVPTKTSGASGVFPGDWGEAVVAKSSDSDDWETPAKDWLRSSESQTTASNPVEKDLFKRNRRHIKPRVDMLEEKKTNEEYARDSHLDDDPFGTTHLRDADILQAAKQKSFFPDAAGADHPRALAPPPKDAFAYHDHHGASKGVRSPESLVPSPKGGNAYHNTRTLKSDNKRGQPSHRDRTSFEEDVFADASGKFEEDMFVDSKSSFKDFDDGVFQSEMFNDRNNAFAPPLKNNDSVFVPPSKGRFYNSAFAAGSEPFDGESIQQQYIGPELLKQDRHDAVAKGIVPEVTNKKEHYIENSHDAQEQNRQALSLDEKSYNSSREEEFFDAPTTDYSGPPGSAHERYQDEEVDPVYDDEEENPADYVEEPKSSKKHRKGFFNFFGGGKKDKDSQSKKRKEKSSRMFGSSRRSGGNSNRIHEPPLKESSRVSNGNNTQIKSQSDDKHKKKILEVEGPESCDYQGHSSVENDKSPKHLDKKRSEDDTTISDMTLPTVFKDAKNEANDRGMPPALSTIPSRDLSTPSPRPTQVESAQATTEEAIASLVMAVYPAHDQEKTPKAAHSKGKGEYFAGVEVIDVENLDTKTFKKTQQLPPPPPPPPRVEHQQVHLAVTSYSGPPPAEHHHKEALLEVDDPALDHLDMKDSDSENDAEISKLHEEQYSQSKVEPKKADKGGSRSSIPLSALRKRKELKLRKFEEAKEKREARQTQQDKTYPLDLPAPPSISQSSVASATAIATPPRITRTSGDKAFSPSVSQSAHKMPKFIARHAKVKSSPARSTQSARQEERLGDSSGSGQLTPLRKGYESKFSKVNRAYAQRMSDSSPVPPTKSKQQHPDSSSISSDNSGNSIEKTAYQKKLEKSIRKAASSHKVDEYSIQSQRTTDSSTVGSDIRVLRSILRRPRKFPASEVTLRPPKPVFASYDEKNITDPMQRAGLRLLSAAVIPIQTEVRRFIAMRRALTRMWALIVIQTYARRWAARKKYVKEIKAIVSVQSLVRGHKARDELVLQHVCAIEIQRFVRGYLATMRVYEDIYKVTLVQSWVRMKIAMDKATHEMALVIQLQAVTRGFLTRQRLACEEACAVAIQANWRGFVSRLNYQFDLLDIIIVQNAWRRRVAILEANRRRNAIHSRCATIIQTKWRSYDCTMNYLHYLADVLIAQSAVRRFLAIKHVSNVKFRAATAIQTVFRGNKTRKDCVELKRLYLAARTIQTRWRGFVCYADYMFSIADIVVVQKLARRWLAKREAKKVRVLQREKAATKIQTKWRCFVDETEYVVMKYEYYAARTIQSHWRRFWCFSNFIIALDCSIQVQAVFRGYLQRKKIARMHSDATIIQSVARKCLTNLAASRMPTVQLLASASNGIAEKERNAAETIQRVFRGSMTRYAVNLFMSATKIQTAWRSFHPRRAYTSFIAARRIQTFWRCKLLHNAYRYYRAALTIQAHFRGAKARQDATAKKGEHLAASLIQSAWRGFVSYTDYIFTISDIISAQKMARGYMARKKYSGTIKSLTAQALLKRRAATSIQKSIRGFTARQRYWYTLGCTMQIQRWMRGQLVILQLRREATARLTLQSFARQCLGRQEYLQRKFIFMLISTAEQNKIGKTASGSIRSRSRSQRGDDKKREEAARVIQRFFLMVKREVDRMVRDKKKRRQRKKKKQNRSDRLEDNFLEDAWISAVHSNIENEPLYRQISNAESENGRRRRSASSSRNKQEPHAETSRKLSKKKQRLPPGSSDKPSTIVRLHHDDDQSEFSALTASTANFMRAYQHQSNQSRLRRLGTREMDEDLELEEAFIDAEIFIAKERKMSDKRSSKSQKSRGVSPAPSKQSHEQRSASPAPSKRSHQNEQRTSRSSSPAPSKASRQRSASPAPSKQSHESITSLRRSSSKESRKQLSTRVKITTSTSISTANEGGDIDSVQMAVNRISERIKSARLNEGLVEL